MAHAVKANRPKATERNANRPHHRTTLLTTDRNTFNRVKRLCEGEVISVECPNDLISSARGGKDNVHHTIRRVSLLRRQVSGGYRRVRVRCEQGNEIPCVIFGSIVGKDDGNVFKLSVRREI